MKIAGVVILYHPDIKQLSANINTYASGLKQLYIYDNTETQTPGIEAALDSLHPNIKYHFFNLNEGIAKRLNQAVALATQNQFDYVVNGLDLIPKGFLPLLENDIIYRAKVTEIKQSEDGATVK